jgi:hypothetical protein
MARGTGDGTGLDRRGFIQMAALGSGLIGGVALAAPYERDEAVTLQPALQAALASPKPALIEAVVDADEHPAKPDALAI